MKIVSAPGLVGLWSLKWATVNGYKNICISLCTRRFVFLKSLKLLSVNKTNPGHDEWDFAPYAKKYVLPKRI